MKRKNYLIDDELINKLEANKKEWGFVSVSAFIRFILTKFFKDNNIL